MGDTIQEQTRQCLTNVRAILEAAGSSLDKMVSATVVLAEEDDFAGMNEEWSDGSRPIRRRARARNSRLGSLVSRCPSRPSDKREASHE